MLGVYNYISSRLARNHSAPQSQVTDTHLKSFPLFSSLPPELRRRIWYYALPERLIEASLDFYSGSGDVWFCCSFKPVPGRPDQRSLPSLFAVNAESRELCLEQYVRFAYQFIHPTLDLLYINWWSIDSRPSRERLIQPSPNIYRIPDQPLARLDTVAISIGRHARSTERFGALISCLVKLGSPKTLLLSLAGANRPELFSEVSGFSITHGNRLVLLNMPKEDEEIMAESVRLSVQAALIEQKKRDPAFMVPELGRKLYHFYSGP